MARPRRAASSKTTKKASGHGDATLRCPECGKTFTRPASLGAHRNRAHAVAGASARRASRTGSVRGGGTTRRTDGGQVAQPINRSRRRRAGSTRGASGRGISRDQLLQSLFPNGLPAREEVIRRANAWLDEAERLARVK